MDKNLLFNALIAKNLKENRKEISSKLEDIDSMVEKLVEKHFNELNVDESVEMVLNEIDDKYSTKFSESSKELSTELQKIFSDNSEKLSRELLSEYKRLVSEIPLPKDGENGKDYILTAEDLDNIASLVDIEVPEVSEMNVDDVVKLLKAIPDDEEVLGVSNIEGLSELLEKIEKSIKNKVTLVGGGGSKGGGGATKFIDLTDVPSDYTGHALKSLQVNATEDGLEYYTPTDANDAAIWGNVTGSLSDQTDLQNELDLKANTSDLDRKSVV